MTQPAGIALVGAGAFGEFCLAAFAQLAEARIAAIADTDAARAERFARQYGARACTQLADVLADPDVSIVALNTPPHLHARQGLAVAQAGRHLFCEKPLALNVAEGEALSQAFDAAGTLLTVNYVMRQNPLWKLAADLRQSGVVGDLLHMDLANHAAGRDLPPHHWFWDRARSGGIWVEHGVHFFDAFAWVAGEAGNVLASDAIAPQRVACLARYGTTMAHFYHGFTHSGRDEQTTVQLTFERAHITLSGWVPTYVSILADVEPHHLEGLMPERYTLSEARGGRWLLTATLGDKSAAYTESIQAGMRNLIAAIHQQEALHVTAAQGLASLRMAEQATNLVKA
jgi:predicted dehydrogenase